MTLLHRPETPPSRDAPPLQLRVAAHDQSRVEWICTVPMAPAGVTQHFQVTFEFEIPDAIWVPHDPWQRYQVRTRLTSPAVRADGKVATATIRATSCGCGRWRWRTRCAWPGGRR